MRLHPRRICLGLIAVSILFLFLTISAPPDADVSSENAREAVPWGDTFHNDVPHVHAARKFGGLDATSPPSSPANPARGVGPAQPPPGRAVNATGARVWPRPRESCDRIVDQLDDSMGSSYKRNALKTILAYNGLPSNTPKGTKYFTDNQCPVQNCFLTSDRSTLDTADTVVFHGSIYPSKKNKRKLNQVWVWFQLESPLHSRGLAAYNDVINWTATYRRDSTIVAPYEKFVHFKNFTELPEKPARNYAAGKTKQVAWFVSNCGANNGRLAYAKELGKYINVDIYGPCGQKSCPRSKAKKCFDMLNTDYKFYLAFENSNCRDYITEKFYWNGLWNDVLPVALGAAPEDYLAVAPPKSHIHVDDFESPKQLAEYLHKLDKNDTLYNEYFRWKGTGEFINTKFYCRICRMIHESETYHNWYGSADKWWRGDGVCLGVKTKNNPTDAWLSWRAQTSQQNESFYSVAQGQLRHNVIG